LKEGRFLRKDKKEKYAKGRRGRKRRKIMNDLKERKGYLI
jgi:hypothetical protein